MELEIEIVGNLIFLGASEGCTKLKFSAPNAALDEVKEKHGVKTLTDLSDFAELEAAKIRILCGPPGKPYAINVTSNSIHLQWSIPEYRGSHPILHYCVHYKSLKVPVAKWRTVQAKAFVENLEIGQLSQTGTPFIFKVQAVNLVGDGVPSEKSDPIDLMQTMLIEVSGDIPSKPGKLQAISITHDSIRLEWAKPEKGVKSITSYTILYRSQFNDPPNHWMETRTTSAENAITVFHLFENTTYLFQVLPECEAGVGLESDLSDPITTKMIISSKPGKPRASKVTHNSVELEWTKPEQGAHSVTSYSVLYHSISDPVDTVYCVEQIDPSEQWKELTCTMESLTISNLNAETTYIFKVHVHCEIGVSKESETSNPIKTKPRLALRFKRESQCISKQREDLDLYKLPLTPLMPVDQKHRIAKYCIGNPQHVLNKYPERVLMIVGATGSGKTTLINGMANYIMGVKWEDNFRFKLIVEGINRSPAHSQTQAITAYSFPAFEDSPLPHNLTVVDTPGFGDMQGLERDEQITAQIKRFFSLSMQFRRH